MFIRMCYNGAFRIDGGGIRYLDISTPFLHPAEESADSDRTVFRFRRTNGKIFLIAYPDEWQVAVEFRPGTKIIKPKAIGTPLAVYSYEDFTGLRYGSLKRRAAPEEKAMLLDDPEGFVKEDASFDELLTELPEGEERYIGFDRCMSIEICP